MEALPGLDPNLSDTSIILIAWPYFKLTDKIIFPKPFFMTLVGKILVQILWLRSQP